MVAIDAATNTSRTLISGYGSPFVALNPVTNKIYMADGTSNKLTVIDGATNSTSIVRVPAGAESIAVNPVTNRIYVASYDYVIGKVTVIDGGASKLHDFAGDGLS